MAALEGPFAAPADAVPFPPAVAPVPAALAKLAIVAIVVSLS